MTEKAENQMNQATYQKMNECTSIDFSKKTQRKTSEYHSFMGIRKYTKKENQVTYTIHYDQ